MKRLLKVLACVLLCAAMLCALIFPASGASTIYLMAVNDTVHETTADNMPMLVGGVLYIPYTMLSVQATGINLGVRAQYSAARDTLTVTGPNAVVTFNTRSNTASDADGNSLSVRAMVRNSMVFLPVAWLCSYFPSLNCSLIKTSYCTLVRLTNSAVILSDAGFVDAADDMLRENLARYQASLALRRPLPPLPPPPRPHPRSRRPLRRSPPPSSPPPWSIWPSAGGNSPGTWPPPWRARASGACSFFPPMSWRNRGS